MVVSGGAGRGRGFRGLWDGCSQHAQAGALPRRPALHGSYYPDRVCVSVCVSAHELLGRYRNYIEKDAALARRFQPVSQLLLLLPAAAAVLCRLLCCHSLGERAGESSDADAASEPEC